MFGHGHHYYLDAFKKLGLKIRSNKVNSRRYTADFGYFHKINSHEKAYWLGFMYADGYVSNTQGRHIVGISLAEKDKDHLDKFKKCLKSTYPIHNYTTNSYKKDTKYVRMTIESEEMFNDLVSHGVVPNKTNILKPPNINEEYISSFILGYFDGDGSVFLNNCKSPFYSINIVGTDDILSFIHNYLSTKELVKNKLHLEKRKENQTVSYIRYGGNVLVERILDELYSKVDNTLPLQRKYYLYLKCKSRTF